MNPKSKGIYSLLVPQPRLSFCTVRLSDTPADAGKAFPTLWWVKLAEYKALLTRLTGDFQGLIPVETYSLLLVKQ